MIIDVFCHITPPRYVAAFEKLVSSGIGAQLPSKFLPTLTDVEARFRVMDECPEMVQVLTLTNPPVELVAEPKVSAELARVANDEMAELVAKYPDRFIGAVACLPLNDMDAALRETERAIKELHLCGVQIFSHIMGKQLNSPEFLPLFEKMAEYDLPVWIHPFFEPAGKVTKDASSFEPYRVFLHDVSPAWEMYRNGFEITLGTPKAMTYLIYSGVFDKYPNLKVITHHCGGGVPFFAGRIDNQYDMAKARQGAKDLFQKPLSAYYKMYYGDTALQGNTPSLMCGYQFFGANHMLFGTDMPFDAELGRWAIRETIASVERMAITKEERRKIYVENAAKLLHLNIR